MSNHSPTNAFDTLMQQLGDLPLWIKQVISAQLRKELEATLSKATLDAFGPEHTLQLWVPEISHAGQVELDHPSNRFSQDILRLLQLTRFKKDVVAITILNNWSLENCTQHLNDALEAELIIPSRSLVINSTIHFILGRIRLGEYLVKIGRLTYEQLTQALHTQKAIEEAMNERVGIANVLINLGYIRKEDTEAILFLKEESKRAFEWKGPQASDTEKTVNQLRGQLMQAVQRIRELEAANSGSQRRV